LSPVSTVVFGSTSTTCILLVGDGPVLDAARDHDHLPLAREERPVAQLDAQRPRDDEEQLVLVVVLVPDEGAAQLDGLNVAVVQLRGDGGLQCSPNRRSFSARLTTVGQPGRRSSVRPDTGSRGCHRATPRGG
jgi:hypothetical protein